MSASGAALKRERAKLHAMTDRHQCFKPLPFLIEELNRHLKSWRVYFQFGYPRQAFREINSYVRSRLTQHVKRRSQRPFRPPKGVTYLSAFPENGIARAIGRNRVLPCACFGRDVYRRAGCGKPASPVRRGESESHYCVALSYSTGLAHPST